MALNGFLEFFQKGKVGPGLHLRSNNVHIQIFCSVHFNQLAFLVDDIAFARLYHQKCIICIESMPKFNASFTILFTLSLCIRSWTPLMDRHFGQRNGSLRERYDIHCINKHRPVFNRVLIYDK